VQQTLERAPGVNSANVNLMTGVATVDFDPRATTPEQLVEVIRGTGYGAALPPEAVEAEASLDTDDPARSAELADSVSTAALLLLERLSPLERAVFVLREVFGFSFPEVAAAVGRSEEACRQLAVRARRHMDLGRPRFAADRREREELAARFFEALRDGDVDGLRELLAADVQLVGDGGGKAPALARGVFGADRVARVLASAFPALFETRAGVQPREVNGQPGAVIHDRDGRIAGTITLEVRDGQIQTIRSVVNPDKLRHLGPPADIWAVAGEVRRVRRERRSSLG